MPIGSLHKSHEPLFLGVNLYKNLAKFLRHQKGDIFLLSSLTHIWVALAIEHDLRHRVVYSSTMMHLAHVHDDVIDGQL